MCVNRIFIVIVIVMKRSNRGFYKGIPGFTRENEEELYTFAQRLTHVDQQEIRQKLRALEGQCRLLEGVLEMLEPGYETDSQLQERMDKKKQIPTGQRKNEDGI